MLFLVCSVWSRRIPQKTTPLDSELFIQGGGSHISGIQLALGAPLASQLPVQVENNGRRRSRVAPKMSSERREKQQGTPRFLWSTPLNKKFRFQGPASLANLRFQIVPGICAIGESDVEELARPTARRGP